MSRSVDDELREVERRILWRRERLAQRAHECRVMARRRVASPAALLVVLAGGFFAGAAALRLARRGRVKDPQRGRHAPNGSDAAPRSSGVLALLLPWGLALARARFASPHWALAELLTSRLHRS